MFSHAWCHVSLGNTAVQCICLSLNSKTKERPSDYLPISSANKQIVAVDSLWPWRIDGGLSPTSPPSLPHTITISVQLKWATRVRHSLACRAWLSRSTYSVPYSVNHDLRLSDFTLSLKTSEAKSHVHAQSNAPSRDALPKSRDRDEYIFRYLISIYVRWFVDPLGFLLLYV